MKKFFFSTFLVFSFCGFSYAATTGRISDNVNGMRQLTDANIVRQYPGAAPYYGPSNCQQQLSNFQGQMGPGYSCACPDLNANPVCTPICSVLQPQYQQQAGPQYSCTCPAPNVTPVCTKLNCGQLLTQYQAQYPYPQYSCQCPAGAGSSNAPTCTANPTCSQLLPQVQAGYGSNYTCTCPYCYGGSDANCYAAPACQYTPPPPPPNFCSGPIYFVTGYGRVWNTSTMVTCDALGNNCGTITIQNNPSTQGCTISTTLDMNGYSTTIQQVIENNGTCNLTYNNGNITTAYNTVTQTAAADYNGFYNSATNPVTPGYQNANLNGHYFTTVEQGLSQSQLSAICN